jgi:hypothetical protein
MIVVVDISLILSVFCHTKNTAILIPLLFTIEQTKKIGARVAKALSPLDEPKLKKSLYRVGLISSGSAGFFLL